MECEGPLGRSSAVRSVSPAASISERLAALERFIYSRNGGDTSAENHDGKSEVLVMSSTKEINKITARVDEPSLDVGEEEEVRQRFHYLENAALGNPRDPVDSRPWYRPLQVRPVIEDTITSSLLRMSVPSANSPSHMNQLIEALPPKRLAEALLEHYLEKISWLYHILHHPTTRAMTQNIYCAIAEERKPNPGHMTLLFTILASSAYFWENNSILVMSSEERMATSEKWSSASLLAASEAQFISHPTLEPLQAITLHNHVLINRGTASTYLATLSVAIGMARSMLLHQLDSEQQKQARSRNGTDMVTLELKRRLWWHIVSTDW